MMTKKTKSDEGWEELVKDIEFDAKRIRLMIRNIRNNGNTRLCPNIFFIGTDDQTKKFCRNSDCDCCRLLFSYEQIIICPCYKFSQSFVISRLNLLLTLNGEKPE